MNRNRLLFISGSLGLGHIGRDLEIAKALRNLNPELEISWLAKDPASIVLTQAGEQLLEEAKLLANENTALEKTASNYKVNVIRTLLAMRKDWTADAKLVAELVEKEHFDLVIGDETYDLLTERVGNKNLKRYPFIIIYDMIGVDAVNWNPIEVIATYMTNRAWLRGLNANPPIIDRTLFIGEIDDVLDKKFGFLLPNRREIARKYVDFVGNVLTFNPNDYLDKEALKKQLGYGEEPLIVCSIGGTSAGKELLFLCAQAYPLIKAEISRVRMVLVCGPRLSPNYVSSAEGLEVKGYVPELFKHFAAADLCVVTAGGTTTLELIALQKPFLYFPLQNHFEQEKDVVWRCERYKAGVKMDYAKTTPEILAKVILSNIGKKVQYPSVLTNGAQKAAQLINQVLKNKPRI